MSAPATAIDIGPVSIGRRSHHPYFLVAAVILSPFIVGLHSRLLSIGLADIRGAFGLGFDEGAWLNTAANAGQIFVAPAVAWLVTAFGARRVFVVPSFIYALISLAIPFVRDFQLLLVLHTVHGVLLGLFVPATIIVIVRNLPLQWWLPMMGIYAFRAAFTANTGVSLVGYYTQELGWQWIYWQDVVLAPLIGILAFFGAPAEKINRTLVRNADWGGMILFGSALTLLYVALDQGNRLDWNASPVVFTLLAAGGVLLVAFLINEALVEEPWASAGILLSRNISLVFVAALAFMFASVSNAALIPNFLSSVKALRPEQTGTILIYYVALPLLLTTVVAVWLLQRIDARIVMAIGLTSFALANLLGTGLTYDWDPQSFRVICLLQSVGFGFTFIAVIVFAFANANPARATAFSAYIQVLRVVGAEIGVAMAATFLRVREQLHSNLLGLHVAAGDEPVSRTLNTLAAAFTPTNAGAAQTMATSQLSALISRQANVLSYIDGFWLTFWIALFGLVAIAAMKPAPPGPFTPKRASR